MRSHAMMMHYASLQGKCLLHHAMPYGRAMTTASDRLRMIREQRGYSTAVDAANAMGKKVSTYIQHENGTRGSGGLPKLAAEKYAAFFRVSLDWLVSGKGDAPEVTLDPTDDDLASMIENALRELPVGVPLGEFPRLVAPALRAQLERFRADREG